MFIVKYRESWLALTSAFDTWQTTDENFKTFGWTVFEIPHGKTFGNFILPAFGIIYYYQSNTKYYNNITGKKKYLNGNSILSESTAI